MVARPGIRAAPRWRRKGEQRADPWPRDYELLSQILEELAVLAAERRRPKPREVKRPKWVTGKSVKTGMDRAFGVMLSTANTIK